MTDFFTAGFSKSRVLPPALRWFRAFGPNGFGRKRGKLRGVVYSESVTPEAIEHLQRRCRVMRKLIKKIGPCTLVPDTRRSPFESLVRAVAHQQLNGTAAESILRRLRELCGTIRYSKPEQLLALKEDAIRSCGFSGAKVAALRDIAAKTLDGTIPSSRAIRGLGDEEIIERLTMVRGVGRWTVEMMLIFKLGRPDVLPADDFGVRNGYRIAFGLEEMPRPKEVLAYGERWRPFATTAAWYLWRAADEAKKE
jgi:DNA-3-methyladenine glycosylase II